MLGVLCRMAREAEAAALAKEEEAKSLLPVLEEHERALGPLQNDAMAAQRCVWHCSALLSKTVNWTCHLSTQKSMSVPGTAMSACRLGHELQSMF